MFSHLFKLAIASFAIHSTDFSIFVVSLQNGSVSTFQHIGMGFLVKPELSAKIKKLLKKAWPVNFGGKAPNSKSKDSKMHRHAIDTVRRAVWPPGTAAKFFGLDGFPPRPPFHTARLDVAVAWLGRLWADIVTSEFPEASVRQYVIGRVSCVTFPKMSLIFVTG